MNAAVLVDGWSRGGADGARAALDCLLAACLACRRLQPLQRTPLERLMGRWTLDTSPAYLAIDLMSRVFSPYDLNPTGFNPLRAGTGRKHRFRAPRSISDQAVYHRHKCAHRPRTNLSQQPNHARACCWPRRALPTMFQAVEIERRALLGRRLSPGIPPSRLLSARATRMIPSWSRSIRGSAWNTPKTAGDILDRLNEISFNSPLMKELRMIALLRQAADPGQGEGARWAGMRTHRIMTDKLAEFGASSKLNAESEFLAMLKAEGRKSAGDFLDQLRRRSRQQVERRSRCVSAGGVLRVRVFLSSLLATTSEARMSVVGILIALGLLVWLAYRGWSILFSHRCVPLIAALLAGQPAAGKLNADAFMSNDACRRCRQPIKA